MRSVIFVAIATCFVGCNGSVSESDGQKNDNAGEAAVETVMITQINVIEDDGWARQIKFDQINEPTLEQIESAFDGLPWNDAQHSPYLGLGGTKSGLKIQRPDRDAKSTQLVVLWDDWSGSGPIAMLSPPLDSPDAAKQILIAYQRGDDLLPMIEWIPQE